MRWNLKLGVIVPSWNTVMEYEFQQMAGETASIHSQRIRHTSDTEENLLWMSKQAPEAAHLLAHAKVDAICYGCTGSGFLKTPSDDLALVAELENATGIPSVSSSAAIVRALTALGVTRVSVASPYENWLNEKLCVYLESANFEIVAMKGLGTQAHGSISSEAVKALAMEVWKPESQAILISCSNFRTLDIIAEIERDTRIPVVTSNQAAMWGTLRHLRRDGGAHEISLQGMSLQGRGRLFRDA